MGPEKPLEVTVKPWVGELLKPGVTEEIRKRTQAEREMAEKLAPAGAAGSPVARKVLRAPRRRSAARRPGRRRRRPAPARGRRARARGSRRRRRCSPGPAGPAGRARGRARAGRRCAARCGGEQRRTSPRSPASSRAARPRRSAVAPARSPSRANRRSRSRCRPPATSPRCSVAPARKCTHRARGHQRLDRPVRDARGDEERPVGREAANTDDPGMFGLPDKATTLELRQWVDYEHNRAARGARRAGQHQGRPALVEPDPAARPRTPAPSRPARSSSATRCCAGPTRSRSRG